MNSLLNLQRNNLFKTHLRVFAQNLDEHLSNINVEYSARKWEVKRDKGLFIRKLL